MKKALQLTCIVAILGWAMPAAAHPDPWLTMKTKTALLTAPDVDGTQINVDTARGVVILHGRVETQAEADRAVAVARGIEGVLEVRNYITVGPTNRAKTKDPVAMKDSDIASRLRSDLKADGSLDDSDISVSVNGNVVTLSGTANSMTDHRRALVIARRTPGVIRVESKVVSPNRMSDDEYWDNRKVDKTASKADGKIERTADKAVDKMERAADVTGNKAQDMWLTTAVKMKLMANDQTPAHQINVDTNDGVVTLFGTVPTEASKTAAVAEAKSVGGVDDVIVDLRIVPEDKEKASQARDEDLHEAVKVALRKDPDLKDSKIDVEVKGGVVRLTGSVPTYGERLSAAVIARRVPGVRAVREELIVVPTKPAPSG